LEIPFGKWILGGLLLLGIVIYNRKKIFAKFRNTKPDKTIGLKDPIEDNTNRSKFENGKAVIVATNDPRVHPVSASKEKTLKEELPVTLPEDENKKESVKESVDETTDANFVYVAPEQELLPVSAILPQDANDLYSVNTAYKKIPQIKFSDEDHKKRANGMYSKMYEALLPEFFSGLNENGFKIIMDTFEGFVLPQMSPGYDAKAIDVQNTALGFLENALEGIFTYPEIEIMERKLRNTYPYNCMDQVRLALGNRVKVISCQGIKEITNSINATIEELGRLRAEHPTNEQETEESIKKVKTLVDSAVSVLSRKLLSVDSVEDLKVEFYPCLLNSIELIKKGDEPTAYDVAKNLSILRKKDFSEFIDIEKSVAETSGSTKMTKPENNKSVRRKVKKNGGNGIEESTSGQITLSDSSQQESLANTNGSEIVSAENDLTQPVEKEETVTA
jgi:hypothetical protein